MKKHCAFLAAGLLAVSAAQATVYEFRYTANIGVLLGPYQQETEWLQVPGLDIRTGDTMTGSLFLDTSSRFDSVETGHDRSYAWANYQWHTQGSTRYTLNNDRTGALFAGVPFEMSVFNARPGARLLDSVAMTSYSTAAINGSPAETRMSLSFNGPTSALDHTGIPGTELTGLDQGTYELSVFSFDGFSAHISGNITSLTFVSAVPEPTTYAMLLAGIGLVAWRRKRA